jgi:hypothetical protein
VLNQISITDRVQDDKSYPLCTTLLCCAISILAQFTASRTAVRDLWDALKRWHNVEMDWTRRIRHLSRRDLASEQRVCSTRQEMAVPVIGKTVLLELVILHTRS